MHLLGVIQRLTRAPRLRRSQTGACRQRLCKKRKKLVKALPETGEACSLSRQDLTRPISHVPSGFNNDCVGLKPVVWSACPGHGLPALGTGTMVPLWPPRVFERSDDTVEQTLRDSFPHHEAFGPVNRAGRAAAACLANRFIVLCTRLGGCALLFIYVFKKEFARPCSWSDTGVQHFQGACCG